MNEEYPIDDDAEKIFELQQEIKYLRSQITYLQEALYSAEDELAKAKDRHKAIISSLEQQLGDALYGNR